MALDGITAQLLATELDETLRGARIDKVFQPDKYTVILHIRTSDGIKKLLISFNPSAPRINITSSTRENPQMPPSFCMLLRKYLSGSRISYVKNPGYERLIEIGVTSTDELNDIKELRLIAELMGRYSNLILVNPGGKILDSAIHVDMSVSRIREVMPARIYEYPPAQEKLTPDEALALCEKGLLPVLDSEISRPTDKALLNSILGMSPSLCRQLLTKADIEERLPAKALDQDMQERLIDAAKDLFGQIVSRTYSPSVYFTEEGLPGEYSPFDLLGFPKKISVQTISEATDRYYEQKDRVIDLDNKRNRLVTIINNALMHATRKADIHKADYEEGSKAESFKRCGDLILAYVYMLKDKTDSLTCSDYYEDPPRDITIKLDPTKNASDNAQDYYKRFRKAKRKFTLSKEYLEDDKMAIEYLRSLRAAALSASCEDDIDALAQELSSIVATPSQAKKKAVPETPDPNRSVGKAKSGKSSSRALREAAKRASDRNNAKKKNAKAVKALPYRKYITSDGHTILCGRNNIQNDELTFKVADKKDWWFHIKGMPGTHVILKVNPDEEIPSDDSVIEAAQTAAFFSKGILLEEHQAKEGSKAGAIKAEIDYCPVSHVKKIPGAKPGMVIYEGYYSVVVTAKEPSASAVGG